MSFQNKILRNMELAAENMTKGKSNLTPTDRDIIETTSKVLTRVVPKNKIYSYDECVDYVSKNTKIDGHLVAKALSRAISKKDFAVVSNK